MKNSNPAEYFRNSKQWNQALGETGVVLQATTISVSSPELQPFVPYDYLLIKLDSQDQKIISAMGADGFIFSKGDRVRMVLKKIASSASDDIIPYGLKAEKISERIDA